LPEDDDDDARPLFAAPRLLKDVQGLQNAMLLMWSV
jgi:hypothetical protein